VKKSFICAISKFTETLFISDKSPTSPPLCCILNSVGHRGKFGHEFMEFEFKEDGKLRYANNSNYKKDSMIRKEGKSKAPVAIFCSDIYDLMKIFIA
jgi:hypothetical protein